MVGADSDYMSGHDHVNATALEDSPVAIAITGRLDALEASGLRATLGALIEAGTIRIVVDLSDADFVDSAGLAALVKYMKDARTLGGDLRLVRSRSADANRVFALTKFDEVFVMADDPDELIASW